MLGDHPCICLPDNNNVTKVVVTDNNECTKVQNPRRPRVRESLNACANAGKARAIETQGWLCTLLEALLL